MFIQLFLEIKLFSFRVLLFPASSQDTIDQGEQETKLQKPTKHS